MIMALIAKVESASSPEIQASGNSPNSPNSVKSHVSSPSNHHHETINNRVCSVYTMFSWVIKRKKKTSVCIKIKKQQTQGQRYCKTSTTLVNG